MKALNNYIQPQKFAPEHPNFALRDMQHNGSNPIHQARIQKDFQMLKPKTSKISAPNMASTIGSPWTQMGGK